MNYATLESDCWRMLVVRWPVWLQASSKMNVHLGARSFLQPNSLEIAD